MNAVPDGPEPLLRRGHQAEVRSLPTALRRMAAVAHVSKGRLAVLCLASLGAGVVEAAALLLIVRIGVTVAAGDHTVGGGRFLPDVSIGEACWLGLGLVVVKTALQIVAGHLTARMGTDTLLRLRTATFGAFVDASWSLQSTEREGRLQELLSTHVNRIATGVSVVANGLVTSLSLLALLASAFLVNPLAALAALVAIASLAILLRPLSTASRRQSGAFATINLSFVESVFEAVDLALEAKTFGVGHAHRARTGRRAARAARAYERNQFLGRLVPTLYQAAALALVLVGLAIVAALTDEDATALGAAVVILVRALASAQGLQTAYHQLNDVVPYVDQLLGQLGRYRATAVDPSGRPLGPVERLELRNVSFSYRPDRPVLHDIDLTIVAGEAVGLVGPSGSGKSTLVQVLLRLRSPDSGAYLVNGHPAQEHALADWCRRMAFVPQDVHLPRGTVTDAIRFLRPDIDDAAIAAAAAAAGIAREVESWPDGWSTDLGRRGMELSGGQRQRLALARALAGQPDVLVLDEPTSALDPLSEAAVQATFRQLHGRVTLVVIAHRLSTLAVCDRLVVLEGGRIRACGRPEDVMTSSSFYREAVALWELR